MTEQQAFNKIYRHFVLRGGKPSVRGGGDHAQCLMRGPSGTRCAIGLLIPNKLLPPHMEDKGYLDLVFSDDRALRGRFQKHFQNIRSGVLVAFQRAHDYAVSPSLGYQARSPVRTFHQRIRENLKIIADRHGLSIPTR